MAVLGEVEETGKFALKAETDGSRGPMALLGDDHFSLAAGIIHFALPLHVLVGAGLRFLVLEVIFLAIHEQHHVRVLLDRARFTEIGELRAFVVSTFDLTRELRKRNDRHSELLGERLQAGGDLGDLLHAVL